MIDDVVGLLFLIVVFGGLTCLGWVGTQLVTFAFRARLLLTRNHRDDHALKQRPHQ